MKIKRGPPTLGINPNIISGILIILVASIWFGAGLIGDRIYYFPPVMFVIGLVTLARGFFGAKK